MEDKKQTTPITAHAIFLLYIHQSFLHPGRPSVAWRFAVETGVVDIWPEDSKLEADAGCDGRHAGMSPVKLKIRRKTDRMKHSAASKEWNCIDKDLTSAVRALPKETVNNGAVRMVHDTTRIIFPGPKQVQRIQLRMIHRSHLKPSSRVSETNKMEVISKNIALRIVDENVQGAATALEGRTDT
ncbi:hypothetical protein B0H14DRAFT_2624755 [Mycena olivaceomarginata]|nr:hypothetical protein B0H14DRAFT_2624755 [Mycena olivaceomarginata]